MLEQLKEWLLSNKPYTKLNIRIKHFILFCRTLEPGLSYSVLRREVVKNVNLLMDGEVGRHWMRDRCLERVIRLYGANDQRTSAWHAKRSEMVTASEIHYLFTTPAARIDVMMRKIVPQTNGSGGNSAALIWGTRFEPIAKQLYEERTDCKIIDVSCVQHPVHPFLGASPDGLIIPNDAKDMQRYGRLVEFKCPISRPPKDEIPIAYQYQMQLQMECTGIDECEYVEFRFKQVFYTEWERFKEKKGFFSVSPSGKVVYDAYQEEEDTQTIYWILISIKEDFLRKDPEWMPKHIGAVKEFWDEVLRHRENGTLPDPPAKPALPSLDI